MRLITKNYLHYIDKILKVIQGHSPDMLLLTEYYRLKSYNQQKLIWLVVMESGKPNGKVFNEGLLSVL